MESIDMSVGAWLRNSKGHGPVVPPPGGWGALNSAILAETAWERRRWQGSQDPWSVALVAELRRRCRARPGQAVYIGGEEFAGYLRELVVCPNGTLRTTCPGSVPAFRAGIGVVPTSKPARPGPWFWLPEGSDDAFVRGRPTFWEAWRRLTALLPSCPRAGGLDPWAPCNYYTARGAVVVAAGGAFTAPIHVEGDELRAVLAAGSEVLSNRVPLPEGFRLAAHVAVEGGGMVIRPGIAPHGGPQKLGTAERGPRGPHIQVEGAAPGAALVGTYAYEVENRLAPECLPLLHSSALMRHEGLSRRGTAQAVAWLVDPVGGHDPRVVDI